MSTVDSRLRGAPLRALWAFTAALGLACGSSEADDGTGMCATYNCNPTSPTSPTNDPTNDPTGPDPTDSGGGETTGPVGPPMCTDCAADQVCVQGSCTDVPSMCPCPVETYCNLAENKCVIGCTSDAECDEGRICDAAKRECFYGCRDDAGCYDGQICEDLSCIAGCRDDDGCDTPGHICDAMMCRPGCYTDDDCPLEQLCDTDKKECYAGCNGIENCGEGKICKSGVCQVGCLDNSWCPQGEICKADQCTPGCADSSECGAGKACLDGKCVDGCKVDDECAFGQVCINTKCTPGCGHPGDAESEGDLDRCPVGQACLASGCTNGQNCAKFECSDSCDGECRSTVNEPYTCYGDVPGVQGKCMQTCQGDAQCGFDQYCAPHNDPPNDPNNQISLCRSKCSSDADCVDASYAGWPFDCFCWFDQCVIDLMGFPAMCSYDAPE